MRSTVKGKIAEYRFASEFMKAGYPVFIPLDDSSKVDLLIEIGGKFQKIQVKYVTPKNGALRVDMRSNYGMAKKRESNWYDGEIDFIAVFDPENDHGYLIPADEIIKRKSEISLRLFEPRKKQGEGKVNYAKEYEYF